MWIFAIGEKYMIDYRKRLARQIATEVFLLLFPFQIDKKKHRELFQRIELGIHAILDDLTDSFLIELEREKRLDWRNRSIRHIVRNNLFNPN